MWGAGSGERRGPIGNPDEEAEKVLARTYLERTVCTKRQRVHARAPHATDSRVSSPTALRSQPGPAGVA